jgi:hypothetical protein
MFKDHTQAAAALAEVNEQTEGHGEWELDELLRHHESDPVESEDEVSMRDAFDDLLSFYGCLEIAGLIGLIPDQLPKGFKQGAVQTLCNQHVRRYYRKHYPLLLPDMLLARIAGVRRQQEGQSTATVSLFSEFLHINSILEEDPGVRMLLWFLDDGYYENYRWEDTLAILSLPELLLRAMQRAPSSRNAAETSVGGLRVFLEFCVALDDLLRRAVLFPLFQSAMWHYHAYWFRTIRGDVRQALTEAFNHFESWLSSPAPKGLSEAQRRELRAEAKESIRQSRQVVGRLTGNVYGTKLSSDASRIRRESVLALQTLADS